MDESDPLEHNLAVKLEKVRRAEAAMTASIEHIAREFRKLADDLLRGSAPGITAYAVRLRLETGPLAKYDLSELVTFLNQCEALRAKALALEEELRRDVGKLS